MKVRCLIVDDEPLAIKLLQNHVEQIDSLEVVGYCNNAVKAAEVLRTTPVDLMFLDIKMPQLTGIDFLRTCRHPPAVIFTTAYREYALEGFELDVVDYLLKPITFDRFFKAIERYYLRTAPREESVRIVAPRPDSYIHLRTGNKFHRLSAGEVLYIESIRDYIVVHRTGKEKLSVKYKISDLEEELKDKGFLRIHRSFIINMNKVTAYSTQEVELGNIQLPVGNNYRDYTIKILKAP
ncbi:MAG TPA: response regulator transcription factor [Chitinophaga sp.]|uniref:LytR/AlgR family response regulator transcription factor n=1 Tax=Chitinophaga sp. TaxID=1869181 RepID=UPI002BF1A2DA|nr:response regulator transcription factor [Chitinophaga sp.]HVI47911.1 response regulator transcription factor [Chitinophaga sp.]